MGKEGEGGRRRADGRGERGRAAREGAGAAAAAGLPRLPRSVRPALVGRCLSRCPPGRASPGRASATRPGRASSRPPGRRLASPFLLRLRLLPHKYQLFNPSPDLAAAAAATLRSGLASRDFRSGRPRPASLLLAGPPSRSSLTANPAAQLATAPPPGSGSTRIGAAGTGGGAPPRALDGPRRVTSARRRRRHSASRGPRPWRCSSEENRHLGQGCPREPVSGLRGPTHGGWRLGTSGRPVQGEAGASGDRAGRPAARSPQ